MAEIVVFKVTTMTMMSRHSYMRFIVIHDWEGGWVYWVTFLARTIPCMLFF